MLIDKSFESIMDMQNAINRKKEQDKKLFLGQQQALKEFQSVNQLDPLASEKTKKLVEKKSDGKYTTLFKNEIDGMGIDPRGFGGTVDQNGLGANYSIIESESEKAKRDPNSLQNKARMQSQIALSRENEWKYRNKIPVTNSVVGY